MLNQTFLRAVGGLAGTPCRYGASTVRRLSLWPWLTRFSCILVMGRKNALISLTVFETKNEMRVHTRFARTCNTFRVSGVIVRMPYLPSQKVR